MIDVLKAGDLAINLTTYRVAMAGVDVHVTRAEYNLLVHLMQNPGRVYSRAQLLDAVWGRYVDERTVDVHVARLRKSLKSGREGGPIRTVCGVGYSFNERWGRAEVPVEVDKLEAA